MALARREAEIVWEGTLARGAGTLTTGSGALDQIGATWASRTERADGRTSPEELLASAHASCFAMALALVLGENETPPDRVRVSAACTLDEVAGAPRITRIDLTVRAQVEDLEAPALARMVERAGARCPVSNALRGNVAINLHSELVPSPATPSAPRRAGHVHAPCVRSTRTMSSTSASARL
jgi:osmotically inducible protein OsmC